MAQINYNQIDFNSSNGSDYAVKFFTLKADNEEAIVRIMHDSLDTFDILTTHEIRENGNYRGRVSCLRDPRDEIAKCPLCAANIPVAQRMYIHLIHYVQDGNGNIVPQACVWERSIAYAKILKSYIDNYGPLSDIICKIIRHGAPRDQRTRYEIIPNLNKMVYRDDIYVKDTSLFESYTALGNAVSDRSYEDLSTFVATGTMPQVQQNNNTSQPATVPNTIPTGNNYTPSSVPTPPTPPAPPQPSVPGGYGPAYTTPPTAPGVPPYTAMPTASVSPQSAPNGQLPRPNRTYY